MDAPEEHKAHTPATRRAQISLDETSTSDGTTDRGVGTAFPTESPGVTAITGPSCGVVGHAQTQHDA